MVLRRIDIISMAMISSFICSAAGLIMGFLVSGFGLMKIIAGLPFLQSAGPFVGPFLALRAVFVFPILCGAAAFLGGLLIAVIYNLIRRWTGGLKLEFEREAATLSHD